MKRIQMSVAAACAVAVAVGGLVGMAPTASASAPEPFAVEAESMSWSPSNVTATVADGSASAGNAVGTIGAATGQIAGTTGALRQISVTARGDRCQGSPVMQVKMDGVVIGTTNVTTTGWTKYDYVANVPGGNHQLSVSFTNPYSQQFFGWTVCSRVLYVDKADIYGADTTPTPVSTKYVSLGDSYSSGMGSEKTPTTPVNTGVYDQNSGNCYRSSLSAARLLAAARSYTLTDVSCAGATTANILTSGQYGQPAQITGVSTDTGLVTLTIGGNDVGILSFIGCAIEGECTSSSPTTQAIQAGIAQLQPKVAAVLSAIKTAAPNAQIRIAGYPYILSLPDSTDPGNCTVASQNELQLFGDLTRQTNNAIKQVAQAAGSNIQYVDPMSQTSPFMQRDSGLDRGACSTNSARLFNGPTDEAGYWHPNAGGFSAYATLYSSSL